MQISLLDIKLSLVIILLLVQATFLISFRQLGGCKEAFADSAESLLPSAQNNSQTKLAHSTVACSKPPQC